MSERSMNKNQNESDEEYYDVSLKQDEENSSDSDDDTMPTQQPNGQQNFEMLDSNFSGEGKDIKDENSNDFHQNMNDLLNSDYEQVWRTIAEANNKSNENVEDQQQKDKQQKGRKGNNELNMFHPSNIVFNGTYSNRLGMNSNQNNMAKRSYAPLHYDARNAEMNNQNNYQFAGGMNERPLLMHSGHDSMNATQRMRYLQMQQQQQPGFINSNYLNGFVGNQDMENAFAPNDVFGLFQEQQAQGTQGTSNKKKKGRGKRKEVIREDTDMSSESEVMKPRKKRKRGRPAKKNGVKKKQAKEPKQIKRTRKTSERKFKPIPADESSDDDSEPKRKKRRLLTTFDIASRLASDNNGIVPPIVNEEIGRLPPKTGRGKKKKHFLPPDAVMVLRNWFLENIYYPYPDAKQKQKFSEVTGLTTLQVSNWFTNTRKRTWAPVFKARGIPIKQYGRAQKKAAAMSAVDSDDEDDED